MCLDNHTHIHHILLYPFEKGWKAVQSFCNLNKLFGKGTISESWCREWFAHFKSGGISLKDKSGRDWPLNFNNQALLASMEEDESLTPQMVAEDFNVNHSTIVHCLKKFGKVWKLTGRVSHKLSDNNKAKYVWIFTNLLQQKEQAPFLKNLITGNESWFILRNIIRKKVCISPGVFPKVISKNMHYMKAL